MLPNKIMYYEVAGDTVNLFISTRKPNKGEKQFCAKKIRYHFEKI